MHIGPRVNKCIAISGLLRRDLASFRMTPLFGSIIVFRSIIIYMQLCFTVCAVCTCQSCNNACFLCAITLPCRLLSVNYYAQMYVTYLYTIFCELHFLFQYFFYYSSFFKKVFLYLKASFSMLYCPDKNLLYFFESRNIAIVVGIYRL